jgi:hypothetical protein
MIFGFNSESLRAEIKPHFHRAHSNDTAWFVTAPWEQLALVTDHRFHWRLLSCPNRCSITGRHGTRFPAGLSSWEKITERVWFGSVGRTCRSFLLAVVGFSGAGLENLFRSHCGRYWAMVICVSFG